jgi:hypothetical protein
MGKILATHTASPASAYWLRNEHYDREEAFVYRLPTRLESSLARRLR